MNDYQKALEFWNQIFAQQTGYAITGKFVENATFNNIINEYVKAEDTLLDFGCGSGWGLPEIYFTKHFTQGIGIDISANSIKVARECSQLSSLDDKLTYFVGDQKVLDDYQTAFDFIFSTNTIDVVPDEVTTEILDAFNKAVKSGGYLLICLNPNFTEDELINLLKMEKRGNYYYKNDILRCNYKSIAEWENIFKAYFTILKSEPFVFSPEEKYQRHLYLLQK